MTQALTAVPSLSEFLACETPDLWINSALQHLDILLIDHANCEKKAASTALNLMFRYVDRTDLLNKMSCLAREELRHFEQVLAIITKRNIAYTHIGPSRYAKGLMAHQRSNEPGRLIDSLIIGAFIEARSCERFGKLAPFLDAELGSFYRSLLKSEMRHFQDYLRLAQEYSTASIEDRIRFFAQKEADLILSPDTMFRFHSGPVCEN